MSKEKRRVPKLRFPGFTEDWEQRKLGDYLIPYTEITTQNNQYPVLTSSRKGLFFQTDYYDGNQIASKDNTGYNIVPYGYFTYRHMSDDEIFHFNINYIVDKGIVSTLYPVFTTKNLNSNFLQLQLNYGNEFRKYAVLLKQGGSRTYMYFNKLKNLNLTISTSIGEQEIIAKFFILFEKLITLHQRKLEHLNLKKKALFQKLFPKNGERYPELRFPGFTDAWEQRKFKDLFIERREKTIRENEETLLSCAITGIYLNSELFSHFRGSSTIGYLKIKKYDLILSAQNLHLGNANINLSFDKGMISPAYKVFELKSIDPYFINAWVKKDSTKNFFLKATTEGASQCRKNIEWDVLLNQEIPVPNKLEQRTIGRFINNIDMIITLHQRKLEHLQLQKKALLQQMFV